MPKQFFIDSVTPAVACSFILARLTNTSQSCVGVVQVEGREQVYGLGTGMRA